MAGKVVFRLETLQEQALAAADQRVEAQREVVNELEASTDVLDQMVAWRERYWVRLADFYTEFQTASYETIAAWRPEPMPKVDEHRLALARKGLRNLEEERARIVAKSRSLAPDADGNVALTRAQMSEFFGL